MLVYALQGSWRALLVPAFAMMVPAAGIGLPPWDPAIYRTPPWDPTVGLRCGADRYTDRWPGQMMILMLAGALFLAEEAHLQAS